MSKVYSILGPSQAGTGPLTATCVIATAAIRPMVNEILFGVTTTPADQVVQVNATRVTTAGTTPGSTPTPGAFDPADVACVSTGGITYSAEPTVGTNLLSIEMNQRATFRWVAQDGRELVAPATANNGISCRMVTAGASMTLQATEIFRE